MGSKDGGGHRIKVWLEIITINRVNLRKLYLILFIILLNFLLNNVPVFAYSDGLIQGKSPTIGGYSNVTDNNLETWDILTGNSRIRYDLGADYDLDGLFWKVDIITYLKIKGYDSNNALLFSVQPKQNNTSYSISYSKVRYVEIENYHSSGTLTRQIFEFDVYGKTYPSVPSGLSVSGTGNSVNINWYPNPVSENVTSYRIYDNEILLTTLAGTSYNASGLLAGTHSFQVSAVNSVGASALCTAKNFYVAPSPPVPAVDNITTSAAAVTWPSVYGATSYNISINGSFLANTTATTYNLSGLNYNTSYTVSVIAKSSIGSSSPGSVTFTTLNLLLPPEGLQVTNITSSTLDLSWNAVSGAITYILDQNDTILATTTDTFYYCTGLSPNTTYTYKVAVTTELGESNYSDPVVATTLGVPPQAPTGLSAGNLTYTSFTLYWFKQSNATNYKIYLDCTLLGNVNQPLLYNPSFDIANLTEGSTHFITVTAVNEWGESTASQPLNVTLFPAPTELQVSNISTNSLDLAWTSISGAISYVIFQDGNQIANTTDITYNITNLTPNTAYSFQVAVVNDAGQSPLSNTVNITTLGIPPITPTGLSAGKITPTSFTLYWLRQSDATSYNVYMDGTLVGNVSQPWIFNPSFDIKNLTEGATYVMTVTAVNEWGESTASQPLPVTATVQNPVLKATVDTNKINLTWTGTGSSFDILVNNEVVAQATASSYTLTKDPGTYKVQIIQN